MVACLTNGHIRELWPVFSSCDIRESDARLEKLGGASKDKKSKHTLMDIFCLAKQGKKKALSYFDVV